MSTENPYQSPESPSDSKAPSSLQDVAPATFTKNELESSPDYSTSNTLLPRHIAAILDNLLALVLGIVVAQSISENLPLVQFFAIVMVYLVYYFLFEGLVSRTPGKWFTGLVVVQFDGKKCTWRQSLIRTVFRLVEVNPVLFGALPAAASIIFSKHHQRIGDQYARTIVIPARRL